MNITLCYWCGHPADPENTRGLCEKCEAERVFEEVLDGMETAE